MPYVYQNGVLVNTRELERQQRRRDIDEWGVFIKLENGRRIPQWNTTIKYKLEKKDEMSDRIEKIPWRGVVCRSLRRHPSRLGSVHK